MSNSFNRRKFLGTSLATAGASVLQSTTSWASIRGANEDIRVAILGVGGRGGGHVGEFSSLKGVRVVAVCDADYDHAVGKRNRLAKDNKKADAYQDYRKILERKDVDAVVIATPNHWHAPMSVHAAQAGKDVYVEKPVTHNIWEGQRLIDAAKKYNVMIMSGMQRRSSPGWKEAIKYVQDGELGKIKVSRGLCYKRRKSIGKVGGPQQVPDTVDYNLWSGPAQIDPIMRGRFHYDWHWQWAYGNGDLGNQGVHQTDVARWALGADSLPKRVISVGGRFGYEDDGETPNTQFAIFDYDEGQLIFEVRGLGITKDSDQRPVYRVKDGHKAGITVGNVIECENGYVAESKAYDYDGKEIKKFGGWNDGSSHQSNFIKAVRSRKESDIEGTAKDGHLSAAICHAANVCHRVGAETSQEAIAEQFKGNDSALATFEDFKEHLAVNGLKDFKPVMGPVLEIDREKEIFTGAHAEAANKHLSRHYRPEFGLTEDV
jgi:predicted dehydrogenase